MKTYIAYTFPHKSLYAHIEKVVAFLVVNFFGFFGHSSLPYHALLTKIGGNVATGLPDLSKPKC